MTRDRSDCAPATRTGTKRLTIVFGSLLAVALCVAIRYYWGAPPANAQVADSAPARQASLPTRASGGQRPLVAALALALRLRRIEIFGPGGGGHGQHPADHARGARPPVPPNLRL